MIRITRDFPLPRIQCGALLGNGLLGAMLWGQGRVLNCTLGCAGLWDHRGGLKWSPEQNFRNIREALEKRDRAQIDRIFAQKPQDGVRFPILLSLGRVVVTLPEGAELLRHEQELSTGLTRIFYDLEGSERNLEFCSDMSCRHGLFCRGLTEDMSVRLVPAWDLHRDFVSPYGNPPTEAEVMQKRGFSAPETFAGGAVQAFVQSRPNDPSFGLKLERRDSEFGLAFSMDVKSLEEMKQSEIPGYGTMAAENLRWWQEYWESVPDMEFENVALEEIYWHGMYKYGIMTNPAGVTPGLQGPWIEDSRLPPWSGDYHFNINVQMCNGPGLKAGRFQNLRPLFDMVFSWKPQLRYNARCFAGIEDGYMLPHAVDDRGTCMGAFWAGNIDHACSAWVAQMMFDYCDYSGDREYLREHVFDFMQGVLNVFKVMLEPAKDGSLKLPVSVSPEYRADSLDAWGCNSSFQLAAIHNLVNNLRKAAAWLGVPEDPSWKEIAEKLPQFSVYDNGCGREIGMWDGTVLEESHRHHSHLGGICPFDTLDPEDPELAEILKYSIFRWTEKGMGLWSGWCVPWASQIRTRLGQPETAVYLLETWKKFFNNEGGGSLHNAHIPGLSAFHDLRSEIMQMDGAMGAVSAVQDLMAYSQNGVIHVFYGIPGDWKNAAFRNMHLPGGLVVSGQYRRGGKICLAVTATRSGTAKFRFPGRPDVVVRSMQAGEKAKIEA